MMPVISGQNEVLPRILHELDHGFWEFDTRSGLFCAATSWLNGRTDRGACDAPLTMQDWLADVHADDRELLKTAVTDPENEDDGKQVIPYRRLGHGEQWRWFLCKSMVSERDTSDRALRFVGSDTDITEAMKGQHSINRVASKLKLAVEASGMGIWEFNPATQQVHWDDRMLEIYGITDGENTRSDNLWEKHLHPDDYEETVAYAEECKRLNQDFKRDYRIVRPSGKIRYIRSLARTVVTPDEPSKLIGVNIDVTEDYHRAQELEAARARLEHEALHDELTGLGNRRALDQAATALFNHVVEHSRYAVMQIDLDHFKEVNDTLGHSAGDFVLTKVAQAIRCVIGERGQPFRVGGDEFAVLFEDAPDPDILNSMCAKLIDDVSQPMEFEGQSCTVGASIGYAIGEGPPAAQSELFINADTALYAAKRAGRFTYRAYTESIGEEFQIVSNRRQDLRDALAQNQLVCFFQPQYDAQSLEIVGAEALVRWQCPRRGLLTPAEFLPSAVDAGLLDQIDRYVFERVADLQTEWQREGIRYPRISVNLSRARLNDEGFLVQTKGALKDHHRFAFELLETSFYDRPSTELLLKLDTLREIGIQIEMDDFGTGHASVKALQSLQPDAVKIDRSLVKHLGEQPKQLKVLQSLSRLARLEGARVVVEGLETGAHMAAIRMLDCDTLQGYVLQRPMAEIDFAALLAHHGRILASPNVRTASTTSS